MAIMTSAMLALYGRTMGMGGQRIWLDMLGANAYANADDFVRYRGKPPRMEPDADLYGTGPLSRLYRCRDDSWIYLGLHLEKEWRQFCRRIGSPDLAEDGRFSSREGRAIHSEALSALLADLFHGENAEHWEAEMTVLGLGCVRADGPLPPQFWLTDEHVSRNELTARVDPSALG